METLQTGVEKLRVIREKQFQDYIGHLDSIGFDRLPRVSRSLAQLTEDPLLSGVAGMRPPAE